MLAGSSNPYDILGIDRDADKKIIKKAYAELVKQYHPEEHPEEWKRIHDAYEQAMEQVSAKKQKVSVLVPQEAVEQEKDLTNTVKVLEPKEAPNTPTETPEVQAQPQMQSLSAEQQDKLEDIFGDVEKVVHEQLEEQQKSDQKKIDRELQTIRQLTKKKRLRFPDEWMDFFSRRNLLPIISQRDFLMGMGDCLTSKMIDDEVYVYLRAQIERIADYLKRNNVNLTEPDSEMDAVRYVRDRLEKGNKVFKRRRKSVIIICIIVFVVFEFWRPLVEDKYSPEAQYQQYYENK